ncbi:hypothetical protein [Streptomyces globosus]
MPGWSAFLSERLGLPVDLATRMPAWPQDRLLPPGSTLPASVPLYFHELS